MLIAGITFLHYSTDQGQYYFHAFYGELYFLPIALAAFWFRLHGALIVSITISACYLPFVFRHWQSFSPNDLDKILSLLLYNGLAVLAGVLKGQETDAQEKLLQVETLAVMGRSLAAVAHDMRTPFVVYFDLTQGLYRKIIWFHLYLQFRASRTCNMRICHQPCHFEVIECLSLMKISIKEKYAVIIRSVSL